MSFSFTEEDFERYVTQEEHGGRHIWHELQDQLEALFGIPFSGAPYIARGDRLRTLWFSPRGTPRSVWMNQAQFFLARSIENKHLSFGLMVECVSPSEVAQSSLDPNRDGIRLIGLLENAAEFACQLDGWWNRPGWQIVVSEWGKDWRVVNDNAELLGMLKRMPEEQGWSVHVERVLSAEEALAAGEGIVHQIMDAYRAVRPLWEAVIPEADREFIAGEEPPVEQSKRDSEDYARQIIESLLPEPESRRVCLNLLADYIVEAHQHSPATWEVTLFANRVRLNIGSIQTFVIYSGEVYLVTDAGSLTDQDRDLLARQGETSLETYVSVPETYDVQLPAHNLSDIVSVVRKSCAPLIERAFKGGKRTPYYRSHSPGVLKYMRSFLGRRDIPDPDYGIEPSSPPLSSSSFNLRATLNDAFAARGLTYTPWQIATFYTALQTKGFVILSGISGTGKTKLAQAFAEALPQPIALLGAADPVADRAVWSGEPLAYWWSYPIRDDVKSALITPFRLYIYHEGQVTHVYTVDEVVVQAGSEGISSPWPEMTLPKEVGKAGPDNHPDWKFKTWCKVTQMAELERPLDLVTVQPLFGYANHPEALRHALVPIADPHPEHNWLFLPVRPDWRDSKSLLGYYNPLTRTYEWTPFLRFIMRVAQNYRSNSRLAWFVILDEMNLAHVEYYFADLLSVLESGRDCDGWTREPLRLIYPEETEGDLPPRELRLPPNLYIVGTVNVDETTHAFSPKVLDRAFALEMVETDFADYPRAAGDLILDEATRAAMLAQFTREDQFACIEKETIAAHVAAHPEVLIWLQALSDLLRPYDLHFGYRVFDETVAYLAAADRNGLYADLGGADGAFDAAVLMKVLPKFHGSRGKLEHPLQAVLAWCVNPENPDPVFIQQESEKIVSIADLKAVWGKLSYRFPATARRVQRMLRALYDTGFAAFG